MREDKDGKNGVFEEEPPNTLLTLSSSDIYSLLPFYRYEDTREKGVDITVGDAAICYYQ